MNTNQIKAERRRKEKFFIYLDESGDLGKLGTKHFNITAICTYEPNELARCIKKVRSRKLKKDLKELSEIKANNSDEMIRKAVLNQIAKTSCSINVITVNKEKVFSYLYEKKEKLYNYITGALFEKMNLQDKNIEVVIDKRAMNTILKEDFDSYIRKKVTEGKLNAKLNIKHLQSHEDQALQAADFVAWAVNRKFSSNDDSYYKIIEGKVSTLINLWE